MGRGRRILLWVGLAIAVIGGVRTWAVGGGLNPPAGPQPEPSGAAAPGTSDRSGARPAGVPAGAQEGRVVRVVDGDTIEVAIGIPGGSLPMGDDHRVRMLEIDTPETVRPNHPVQCGGPEAAAFARAELPVGSAVYLLADRQERDSFGRYLRYVWDFEGELYNEKAVAEGLARAVLYQPNDLFIDRIRRAEASARRSGRGVWGKVCPAAQ